MKRSRDERSKDEDRLADDFGELRADVEAGGRLPDFNAMMVAARDTSVRALTDTPTLRHRRAVSIGGWVSLAAAATAAGLLLVGAPADSAEADFERLVASYTTDGASGGWVSPTASLLDTPGVDLGAVPSFGGVLRGMPARTTEPEGRDS